MLIRNLTLYTDDLNALHGFYKEMLPGCRLSFNTAILVIEFRQGELRFLLSEQPTCYHFAINVPFPQIDELAEKVSTQSPILPGPDGKPVVEFPNWNARSVYFKDPGGNIVELIGRKDYIITGQPEGSPFLNISEIGLATDDFIRIREILKDDLQLESYWTEGDYFNAFGDPEGLFILVDSRKKQWFPTNQEAYPYGFRSVIEHTGNCIQMRYDGRRLFVRKVS